MLHTIATALAYLDGIDDKFYIGGVILVGLVCIGIGLFCEKVR